MLLRKRNIPPLPQLEDSAPAPAPTSTPAKISKRMMSKKRKTSHPSIKSQLVDPAPAPAPDPASAPTSANISDRAKVTECLRTFNKWYLHSVQEEEKRYSAVEKERGKKKAANSPKDKEEEKQCSPQQKGNTKKKATKSSKVKVKDEEDVKRPSKRPDLKATTMMRTLNLTINSTKTIGPIPGIDVGHQFLSRAEMVVVGLHHHWLNGIDYIGQGKKPGFKVSPMCQLSQKISNFPLTVAIVVSGQYEDDLDKCEEIIYTGQGGNDLLGNKKQIKDQKMASGNLGLKNCEEQSVPVRVIRGHKCQNSYTGKVYTYDGLYKVVGNWVEKGVSGFTVYKFRLRRCEGQPPLTTNQVLFTRTRLPVNSSGEISGLVSKDISNGQERIPIVATNLIDEPPVAPTGLTYTSKMVVEGVDIPPDAPGCKCKGNCSDPSVCACARLNGGDFPYVQLNGGRLVEAKDIVFECNPNCGCGPNCVNRTSKRELHYRFEVFRTLHKGWGVRSWDYIPSGAPICEYIGVLKKTDDVVDSATGNCYVFEIDCLQTIKGLDGRQRRLGDVSLPKDMEKKLEQTCVEYCVDAGTTGNFARFINHSCEPNLFVQCILSTHHEVKLARIVLIAADNIQPLTELSYDYAYPLDSVVGPDGKVVELKCSCGAPGCRKRLY